MLHISAVYVDTLIFLTLICITVDFGLRFIDARSIPKIQPAVKEYVL